MTSPRRAALEAMVAADPADTMARLLLGNDCLADGDMAAAEAHLARYLAGVGADPGRADVGAACLSLSKAREALGDLPGALAALAHGIGSATAFRHRALLDALVAERDRLAPGGS